MQAFIVLKGADGAEIRLPIEARVETPASPPVAPVTEVHVHVDRRTSKFTSTLAPFRDKALTRVAFGEPIAVVAADIGVSVGRLYSWCNQERVMPRYLD